TQGVTVPGQACANSRGGSQIFAREISGDAGGAAVVVDRWRSAESCGRVGCGWVRLMARQHTPMAIACHFCTATTAVLCHERPFRDAVAPAATAAGVDLRRSADLGAG